MAGSQWLLLVVLAKLSSPETVGHYGFALAVTAPLIILFNLQLRNVQASDTRTQFPFALYLRLRLLSTAAAMLILLVVVFAYSPLRATAPIFILVGAAKAVEALGDLLHGRFQQHERFDLAAASFGIRAVLSVPLFAVTLHLTESLEAAVAVLGLSWAATLLIFDLAAVRSLNRRTFAAEGRHPQGGLFSLLWMTLPLGMAGFLISLLPNVPRFFLANYWGAAEVGVFTALSAIGLIATMLVTSLGQALTPRLAREYANQDFASFNRLFFRLTAGAILLGLSSLAIGTFLAREILTLLYSSFYGEYTRLFGWILFASLISHLSACMTIGLMAARAFRTQLPLYSLAAATVVVGGALLIPRFGLSGAAWAMSLAYGVHATASAITLLGLRWRSAQPAELVV
jgi:O-antigen/teichoic acid export membrane protein